MNAAPSVFRLRHSAASHADLEEEEEEEEAGSAIAFRSWHAYALHAGDFGHWMFAFLFLCMLQISHVSRKFYLYSKSLSYSLLFFCRFRRRTRQRIFAPSIWKVELWPSNMLSYAYGVSVLLIITDRNCVNSPLILQAEDILRNRDCHHPCLPNCRARISGRQIRRSTSHFPAHAAANPLLCGRNEDKTVLCVSLIHAPDFLLSSNSGSLHLRERF